MKTRRETIAPRRLTLAVAGALVALAAGNAAADPLFQVKLFRDSDVMFRDNDMSRWSENYLELGLAYNSDDSFRFGQFSGLTDSGALPLLGFNWLSRDAADDTKYWRVFGANLGVPSRKVAAEAGIQGRFNARFSLDQLDKAYTETGHFLHNGLGTDNLTLPTGVRPGAYVSADKVPTALFKPYEIRHGRDIYRLGFNGELGGGWNYKLNFREDHRDGTRLTGLYQIIGMIVPYPINDRTRQIEAALGYTGAEGQMQLGYTFSHYENNVEALDVQNPFATNAASLVPNLRMSLNPSNDYHQLSFMGGYNFGRKTRLTTKIAYGTARQDENFLPYSANGAAATQPLPMGSLDGKVATKLIDTVLTAKPLDKMNLRVGFQYRDVDNQTPIARFVYAGRDALTVGAANSAVDRQNAPISTTERRAYFDADYLIADRTTLRAGLERARKTYTLTDRTLTNTDKLSLELRRPVSDEFIGSTGYAFTRRTGSAYDKGVFFRNTYAPGFVAGATGKLDNIPSMRSYIYGDYDEHRVRAAGNWIVDETLSIQGGIDNYRQKNRGPDCDKIVDPAAAAAINAAMPDRCLGRNLAEGQSLNVDLQYQPEETLTTFAFANYSLTKINQRGRRWSNNPFSQAADSSRDTAVDSRYRDTTLGVGLKWQPEERWDLGSTFVNQRGRGLIDPMTGSSATAFTGPNAVLPLPDLTTRLNSLQLFAKFDYSKNLSWRFNYVFEDLRTDDWSYDGLSETSARNVLLTGQAAPRYSNHVFGASAVIKNW